MRKKADPIKVLKKTLKKYNEANKWILEKKEPSRTKMFSFGGSQDLKDVKKMEIAIAKSMLHRMQEDPVLQDEWCQLAFEGSMPLWSKKDDAWSPTRYRYTKEGIVTLITLFFKQMDYDCLQEVLDYTRTSIKWNHEQVQTFFTEHGIRLASVAVFRRYMFNNDEGEKDWMMTPWFYDMDAVLANPQFDERFYDMLSYELSWLTKEQVGTKKLESTDDQIELAKLLCDVREARIDALFSMYEARHELHFFNLSNGTGKKNYDLVEYCIMVSAVFENRNDSWGWQTPLTHIRSGYLATIKSIISNYGFGYPGDTMFDVNGRSLSICLARKNMHFRDFVELENFIKDTLVVNKLSPGSDPAPNILETPLEEAFGKASGKHTPPLEDNVSPGSD